MTDVREISLEEAWQRLAEEPSAQLLDVRTMAEWSFVGVPDLSTIDKEVHLVEWTQYPTGAANPDFLTAVRERLDPEAPVLVLCRSGARSHAAAGALLAAGFAEAINVVAGFEGGLDEQRHRHGGWKDALPWIQQ